MARTIKQDAAATRKAIKNATVKTTEAPATEAPATEAPKTEAPATEAPKTEAPKTEAPKVPEPDKTHLDGLTNALWSGTLAAKDALTRIIAALVACGASWASDTVRIRIYIVRIASTLAKDTTNRNVPPAKLMSEAEKIYRMAAKERTKEQNAAVFAARTYYSQLIVKAGLQAAPTNGGGKRGANKPKDVEKVTSVTSEPVANPLTDPKASVYDRMLFACEQAAEFVKVITNAGLPKDFVALYVSANKQALGKLERRKEADAK